MIFAKTYKFAEFTLNPAKRTLFRESTETKLRDKDFEVLLFLIKSAPKPCSHDEIIEVVWDGVSIESNSVDKALTNIRKALNEDRANPRFIKTVRGKGFLFIGDVEEIDEISLDQNFHHNKSAKSELKSLLNNRSISKKVLLAFGILVLIGIGGLFWWKGDYLWTRLTQKVIFSDNFAGQELNRQQWITKGSSVKIKDGVVIVRIDETDSGTTLVSTNFPFNPNKLITITGKLKIFYNQSQKGKVYFGGSFYIIPNVYRTEEDFEHLAPGDDFARGVHYANYDYAGVYKEGDGNVVESVPREGFFLTKPRGRSRERNFVESRIGPRFEPVWDKWFEQKLIYNPTSGDMQIFIDGEKKSEFNVEPMPQMENPQMRIWITPGGWWTNHSIEIDYIEVTQ